MKTIDRKSFLLLVEHYFSGEKPSITGDGPLGVEDAYLAIRTAVTDNHEAVHPSEPLRFTSEPQTGEFDMDKLEFQ